jgi:lipopolysaccharide biosynthesis regulator YciM
MPTTEEIDDKEIPAFSPLPQQDADALLAKEMAAMSVQEREKSLNDIHGVSDLMDEEPSFVRAKMEEMDTELSKLTNNKGKEAYMQAESQNKEYVSCDKFRLKFLRAEMFNAKLAAGLMVRFFDEKEKLFGADKLTKEIKLWDLDEDDRKFLQSGVNQILPQRDPAGRRIITWMPMMFRDESDSTKEREEMRSGVSKIKLVDWIVVYQIENALFTDSIFCTPRRR